jgi:DNA-binding transcriptional LysR family regulator
MLATARGYADARARGDRCRGRHDAMIIRQLVYLDALAREKHFRRAAEACHVSQPTLSAAIVQLEEELGVMIVERGRRFQGFTKEGEVVLAHARRILAEAQVMKESVAELREGTGGRIRLGAIPTALPMIAHITAPFSDRYPGVSLTVLSLTSQEIQEGIDNFELDVGLTYLDNEPLDRVISKPIYQEGYVLLTREDGPLGGRDTIAWAEAAEQKLCLLTGDMQNRRIIDGIFRSVGAAPRPAIETNSIFNLCSHAGIQGVSSIVSLQLLEFFGLPLGTKALRLIEPEAQRMIGLIVADRQPMAPLARNLMTMTQPVAEAGLARRPAER